MKYVLVETGLSLVVILGCLVLLYSFFGIYL